MSDLPVRFLLETGLTYFHDLSTSLQNAVRCLLIRAQVKIREAARGESWCPPGRSLGCIGRKLYELIASEHFKHRMDPVDFKLGLEGLTTAVWAQLNDLYTDVLGGDMPASLADELRGVLSEREGRWMLTFWRQLAARCQASASPQGWGNGPGKATALVPPAPVGMVSSRSVTSLGAASRVRDYLRKNGLRRSEFALKVGITERTLRKLLKTGRVKVAALEQIAAAMGLTKAGLLADPAGREGSG